MILNNRDHYAYDIAKNLISDGEIWDEDVINQSIELIISTIFGERLFNPFFGSPLNAFLFEGITKGNAERLLDAVLTAIKRWETRITIIDSNVRLVIGQDSHTITLRIPYIINKSNITSMFDKKILL